MMSLVHGTAAGIGTTALLVYCQSVRIVTDVLCAYISLSNSAQYH